MADDDDKMVSQHGFIVDPPCRSCAHRSKTDFTLCLAFPGGIPIEILQGKNDHRGPFPGDKGITYTKAPDTEQ